MSTVSAIELKRRGVSALEPVLADGDEAVITVRGKGRYVVMKMETYASLREAELDMAIREARADYSAGKTAGRSIRCHLQRIDRGI